MFSLERLYTLPSGDSLMLSRITGLSVSYDHEISKPCIAIREKENTILVYTETEDDAISVRDSIRAAHDALVFSLVNQTWTYANIKPIPGDRYAIEKNDGSMVVACWLFNSEGVEQWTYGNRESCSMSEVKRFKNLDK